MEAHNFNFGESEIEREDLSEIELRKELDSKSEAPLSFTIATDAAKIKIQLFEDIGENKINALMQGINNVANKILQIDAAAQPPIFGKGTADTFSYAYDNKPITNHLITNASLYPYHTPIRNGLEDLKNLMVGTQKGYFVAPQPYDDFIDLNEEKKEDKDAN